MMKNRAWRGIDPWNGKCYRVRVWVAGHEYVHRFTDPATTLETMQAWRRHTRTDAERGVIPAAPAGTLAADADRYLAAVTAMPTYAERKRDIGLWVAEFGDRPRASIEPVEIRAVRDRWLTVGPRAVQKWELDPIARRKKKTFELVPGPLSASTVNHRLRALENMWTVLDGRRAPNPAREVPEADEERGEARGLPLAIVRAILAEVSDRGQGVKGKARLDGASKAKARLHCMAWLGIPRAQLQLLRREDVDWEGKTCYIRRRRKGRGVEGRRRPVTALGIEALKMLDAADAWGPFDRGVVRRAWRRACDEVQKQFAAKGLTIDLSRVRPYDLRHSFAMATLASTSDVEATRELLGHRSRVTTLHYAASQVPAWLSAAAARLEEAQNGQGEKGRKRKANRSQNRTTRRMPKNTSR